MNSLYIEYLRRQSIRNLSLNERSIISNELSISSPQKQTNKPHLVIFGLGYLGNELKTLVIKNDWIISATVREENVNTQLSDDDDDDNNNTNENTCTCTLYAYEDFSFSSLSQHVTHILITIPPVLDDLGICNITTNIINLIRAHPPLKTSLKWIGYISSTGVYREAGTNWVSETSPVVSSSLKPPSKASARVIAENMWLTASIQDNLPVHIFRVAGIYGA